jgi:acyl-CoA thioesterase
MTRLDDSLVLTPNGEGVFQGFSDPTYEANSGMFGGWTAALVVKAAQSDPRASGDCSSLSMHFLHMIPPKTALRVTTKPVGDSKSLHVWQVDVTPEGAPAPSTIGTVVLTHRHPSDAHAEMKMPEAGAPETTALFCPPTPLPFGRHTEHRIARGVEPFGATDTLSLGWVRENSGRKMDAVQLAYLCDVYAPRVFYISKGPRPSSTVTLNLNILAGPEELSAVGDDWVLNEAIATRIEQSQAGSHARHWSREGKLLATSEQLCWFR